MDRNSHIIARNIGHTYGHSSQTVIALSNIDLDIDKGEFVSVIGPNGSGKTTLLRVIGGLLKPTFGMISINGMDPCHYQKQKQIGFVFQDSALLPWRTVFDNVILPQEINKRNGPHKIKSPKNLIDTVGLGSFQNFYPHQLSGGMKQRVAFARALSTDPEILLMDEPLGSLDDMTRAALRYELVEIWQTSQKTVILVTHSIPEAVIMSDRVLVLSERPGQIHGEVLIHLPRPRFEELEHTADFYSYTEQIKNLLSYGGNSASELTKTTPA